MLRTLFASTVFALLATTSGAETTFTVANTFQDSKLTENAEISTTAFDAEIYANRVANVGAGVELPDFVNFYSIDVSEDLATLTMTVSELAQPFNNPMPAGRFDRYYFTFTGAVPTAASIDAEASNPELAQGASVAVTTAGRLVVEFAEGADFTAGNKLVVTLQ